MYWEVVYGWTLAITEKEIDFPEGCGTGFAKYMKESYFQKCFDAKDKHMPKKGGGNKV
jgi:hypothetical protein